MTYQTQTCKKGRVTSERRRPSRIEVKVQECSRGKPTIYTYSSM